MIDLSGCQHEYIKEGVLSFHPVGLVICWLHCDLLRHFVRRFGLWPSITPHGFFVLKSRKGRTKDRVLQPVRWTWLNSQCQDVWQNKYSTNPSGLQILTKHVGYVGLNPGQRQQSRCNVWHPPFEKRLLLVHVAPISLQSLTSCSLHFILLSLHLPCLVPVFFHITIDNSISYQTCSNRAKTTLV